MKYVIGLDYGSDSVRALIVNTKTGEEVATSVKYYPRWKEGKYCDPLKNQYRQHPLDYLEVLETSIKECLSISPEGTAENVVGIAFDTTGSTPVFTNESGTPLSLLPEFAGKSKMQCLFCGKTIRLLKKLLKLMNLHRNGR